MGGIAYFDEVSGFTAEMLLGAFIDAGADPDKIEIALKHHHAIDCKINVKSYQVNRMKVVHTALAVDESFVLKSLTMSHGGTCTPAEGLISKVIGNLEVNANELWGMEPPMPSPVELGDCHVLVRILALCNALNILGIDTLHHAALPFVPGIDHTQPLQAALMQRVAIRLVDRAPTDLAGCAVLTGLSAGTEDIPNFVLQKVSYGGHRPDHADGDLVRLCTGNINRSVDNDNVQVLETQIDDMNPQFYSYVVDLLLESGALDAFLTPVIMKKNRPGVLLTVLSPPALAGLLSELILQETTTIGLRSYTTSRRILPRHKSTVTTPYGNIGIKIVRHGDSQRYTPEYEECRDAARRNEIPLSDVYAAVHKAAADLDLDNQP